MLTFIVGRNYAQGMIWLRDHKKDVDPQQCRIVTTSLMLKGLKEFKVVWLPGWSDGPSAMAIHAEVVSAKVKYGEAIVEAWG